MVKCCMDILNIVDTAVSYGRALIVCNNFFKKFFKVKESSTHASEMHILCFYFMVRKVAYVHVRPKPTLQILKNTWRIQNMFCMCSVSVHKISLTSYYVFFRTHPEQISRLVFYLTTCMHLLSACVLIQTRVLQMCKICCIWTHQKCPGCILQFKLTINSIWTGTLQIVGLINRKSSL